MAVTWEWTEWETTEKECTVKDEVARVSERFQVLGEDGVPTGQKKRQVKIECSEGSQEFFPGDATTVICLFTKEDCLFGPHGNL